MSPASSSPHRLVILGPPGAGKGTQAKRLSQALGVVHLSTGAMLRRAMDEGTELGRLARPYVEAGELVPDDVMLRVVEHALQAPEVVEHGFLLDGFPRTAEQAEAFLSADPGRLDAVVQLTLEPDEARRRLLARGRGDDRPAVIDHRLAVDAEESGPLLAFLRETGLVVEVDGGGTEDEVAARILAALSKHWDRASPRED
jgi:adenylate kinase